MSCTHVFSTMQGAILFLLICIQLSISDISAQSPDATRFSFIQYDKNILAFPNGIGSYLPFYEKLQTLLSKGEGPVNIMHIGGSHVQAGVWTEGLCSSMQTRMPGISISRGLVFPYRAVGTTQPGDYIVEFGGIWQGCRNAQRDSDCALGLMGISASTRDSNAFLMITSRPNGGNALRFHRLKIFCEQDEASYTMSFPHDTLAITLRDSANTYTLVEFSRTMDTLYLQLSKTDSAQHSFSMYGFRMESEQSGLCVDAIGNNGADLPSYLKCDLFEQQLQAALPDLIILSLGINDAYTRHFNAEQYKNNYRSLVAKIRTVAPDCAILFTTNNDSYYRKRYPNVNGGKVQQAIFELAEECHAGVWDLYTVMGGHKSINQWVSARLARTDRIHFTSTGYHLIGNLLSEALMSAFMEYHNQSDSGD